MTCRCQEMGASWAGGVVADHADRFSKAFEAAPVPVSISTLAEGRFIDVNQSFVEMTGYRRDELIGRSAPEIGFWYRAEDRSQLLRLVEAADGPLRYAEFPIRTRAGSKCVADLCVEVIDLEERPCLLIIYRDVTAQKQAEHLLRIGWSASRLQEQLKSCLEETARIGHAVARSPEVTSRAALHASSKAMVPKLLECLRELQTLQEECDPDGEHADLLYLLFGLQRNRLVESIRDAIEVIGKTKNKFKSKELAELRGRLREAIDVTGGA